MDEIRCNLKTVHHFFSGWQSYHQEVLIRSLWDEHHHSIIIGGKNLVLEQLFQAFGSLNKSKVCHGSVLFQLTHVGDRFVDFFEKRKHQQLPTEPQELEKKK